MAFFKKKDIKTEVNDQNQEAPETKEKSGGLKNLLIGLGVGAAVAGGTALALFKGRKTDGYTDVDGPYENDPDEVTDEDFEEEE